jgi:predicted alpha/beta hydrolase family esterase
MKNVILVHGKNAGPSDKWYPWFADAMYSRGIECSTPELPEPNEPVLNDWLDVIDTLQPDNDTIFVGHSRGGVAILRWLERQPNDFVCGACILVATNSGLNAHRTIQGETNFGFYTDEGYNFDAIRKHCDNFYVLHSKDDQWVPYNQGIENSWGLRAKLLTFDSKGHFGVRVEEIHELVDIIERI